MIETINKLATLLDSLLKIFAFCTAIFTFRPYIAPITSPLIKLLGHSGMAHLMYFLIFTNLILLIRLLHYARRSYKKVFKTKLYKIFNLLWDKDFTAYCPIHRELLVLNNDVAYPLYCSPCRNSYGLGESINKAKKIHPISLMAAARYMRRYKKHLFKKESAIKYNH